MESYDARKREKETKMVATAIRQFAKKIHFDVTIYPTSKGKLVVEYSATERCPQAMSLGPRPNEKELKAALNAAKGEFPDLVRETVECGTWKSVADANGVPTGIAINLGFKGPNMIVEVAAWDSPVERATLDEDEEILAPAA